ncbi:MAG TPA: RNA-binding S4 domain-containing protein [Verrucomicrobiota bacterium]|nr:RNA-binding S4 domain-containing protein [Verrucomicrobiota bacterium]HNU53298.1 RNA-binding S4 domain-containing protein [Verrucomicrobiota bacterium]
MPSETSGTVRLDKWLWAVRIYRTRSLAIAACQAGHVKVDGQRVKPARPVRAGEVVTAAVGEMTRTVKVLGLLDRRVGAAVVPEYLEDLTPPSEYQRRAEPRVQPLFNRPRGWGRPTKRDRRLLEQVMRPAPLE